MKDDEVIKILKEMKHDYERALQDTLQNDYILWRAERYLKLIDYLIKKMGE